MVDRHFKTLLRYRTLALGALLVLGSGSGCGTHLPCLQYQPKMITRTVPMRGFGSVRVTEEAMVCTARGKTPEDLLGT